MTKQVDNDKEECADNTAPFAHLQPFVFEKLKALHAQGQEITRETVLTCLREAADEDNQRCLQWSGNQDYESDYHKEMRVAVFEDLSQLLYEKCRSSPKRMQRNPKWVTCAAALGREPKTWEFMTWVSKQATEEGAQ